MRILLPVIVAGFLVLAGCGGKDDDTPNATATPPATTTQTPAASPTATTEPFGGGTARTTFQGRQATPPTDSGTLTDVRIGAHPEQGGYNRITFEFKGGSPGGFIEYVNRDQVISCGPGELVPVKGNAYLIIHFNDARAYDINTGQPTFPPKQVTGPGPSILESIKICDFEAVLIWAVGTSGQQPFKVTVLDNPPRVAVDVKN